VLGGGERLVVVEDGLVGVLDGAQPRGEAGLACGDGLVVAAAVGGLREGLAVPFDLAQVRFAVTGVGGDGEHGEDDRAAPGTRRASAITWNPSASDWCCCEGRAGSEWPAVTVLAACTVSPQLGGQTGKPVLVRILESADEDGTEPPTEPWAARRSQRHALDTRTLGYAGLSLWVYIHSSVKVGLQ
jgi:hypothetical protein